MSWGFSSSFFPDAVALQVCQEKLQYNLCSVARIQGRWADRKEYVDFKEELKQSE